MFRKKAYTPEHYLKFYQMPQIFYNNKSKYFELMKNAVARELYMILKDRNELSIKNGWIDEEGYIYFYFKQEELAEMLRVSLPTLRKAFNDLKKAELIHVVRQGMNLPNMIYLLQPGNDVEEQGGNEPKKNIHNDIHNQKTQEQLGVEMVFHNDRKNFTIRTERILPSGQKEFYHPDRKNFTTNNTKINYTKRNNNINNNKGGVPENFYYDWMDINNE